MDTLLLEIGAEEIPAGYIEPALEAMAEFLQNKLSKARIDHGSARVFGTPKRLTVEISDVAEKQASLETEVLGPPENVGYDENGKPTIAAEKFAEKVGVSLENIMVRDTPKGRYLCADKVEEGLSTVTLLETILPEVIKAVPFPKTMKWADFNLYFARPIHTLVALYGDQVIRFQMENLVSGSQTRGHRFMSPEMIDLSHPDEYVDKLRKVNVIVDLQERRKKVVEEINAVAESLGGRVLPDEELVDTNKNLVELPIACAGTFDREYLEIPDEILITAMREHQKYFAVIDNNDKLMPCFIAVNNTRAKDAALVAKGHERVIRARLADAQFFYRGDVRDSMESWVEKLKGVLFQAKLGSMHEKIERVEKIAGFIADSLGTDDRLKKDAQQAAHLCKADLVSQVVVEFPKLQGVMGRIYAAVKGESEAVAMAIEEHYRPTYSGGPLPETLAGAIVSIADKMDSICGCFSVGLLPTGASDPYALRRQAIGILQIIKKQGFSFSLKSLIEECAGLFKEKSTHDIRTTVENVYTFLDNRLAGLMVDDGFSRDVVAAVTDVTIDPVPSTWEKVQALEQLKAQPEFQPLAISFKRVVNIIRKAEIDDQAMLNRDVDTALFADASESALFEAYRDVNSKVDGHLADSRFNQALVEIASLKSSVDAFFDNVMVMAEDEKLRANRLAILSNISGLFARFADFSKIST